MSLQEFLDSIGRFKALLLIAIAALAACKKERVISKELNETFAPVLTRYTEINAVGGVPKRDDPYVRGRVLALRDMPDTGSLFVHAPIHGRLPPDLVPSGPTDVGTIAQVRCKEDRVGAYTDGVEGFAYVCDVAIVDLSGPVRVALRKFRGTDPVARKERQREGGPIYGEPPDREIADFVAALPRR